MDTTNPSIRDAVDAHEAAWHDYTAVADEWERRDPTKPNEDLLGEIEGAALQFAIAANRLQREQLQDYDTRLRMCKGVRSIATTGSGMLPRDPENVVSMLRFSVR